MRLAAASLKTSVLGLSRVSWAGSVQLQELSSDLAHAQGRHQCVLCGRLVGLS